jgi:hypothetical protein
VSSLDERMIEHAILFAAGHIGEASQICQHGPGPILPVEPQQGTRLRRLVRGEVARDRHKSLAQLRAVATVPAIPKRAEPLEAVGLTDDSPRPDHLPALTPPVARSTHLIQPAKSRGQVFALRQGGLRERPHACHRHQRPPTSFPLDPPAHPFAYHSRRWG